MEEKKEKEVIKITSPEDLITRVNIFQREFDQNAWDMETRNHLDLLGNDENLQRYIFDGRTSENKGITAQLMVPYFNHDGYNTGTIRVRANLLIEEVKLQDYINYMERVYKEDAERYGISNRSK